MPGGVRSENRTFGLIMAGAFGALALVRAWWTGQLSWWMLGLAVVFLAASLLLPAWLQPVRLAWMKLAAVLGFINSRLLLTIVFGLIITPIGLLLRALGRRPFATASDAAMKTYWRARRPEEFVRERMERQF